MATCPFSQDALSGLLPAVDHFGARLSIAVHHIGGVLESGALDSMYGDADLRAGRLQVCAQEVGGESGLRRALACHSRAAPEESERCFAGLAVDGPSLRACAEGAQGEALLRASIERSQKAKVRESPTFFIDGKRYEGGVSEAHFARALCDHGALSDHPFCKSLPAPTPVDVTLVVDSACKGKGCGTEVIQRLVRQKLVEPRLTIKPETDPDMTALRARAGAPALPFILIDGAVKSDGYGFAALARHVLPIDGDSRLLLPLSGFTPTVAQAAPKP
jgi:hypothetical protein